MLRMNCIWIIIISCWLCSRVCTGIVFHSDEDFMQEFMQLKAKVEALEANKYGNGGAVFVRWGRESCPNTATLVYKGFTAGKHYNEPGSGTDTLCLPDDPVWGNYHDGRESNLNYRAGIYGTEIDNEDIDHHTHIFPVLVNEQDMPCAVCATNRSMQLMIPARNTCYPGWTLEYSGYLMAGSTSFQGYNHICMDGRPDFLQHGASNDNQHILYVVEGHCGSLPCPPYVEGRELTCAVCTK